MAVVWLIEDGNYSDYRVIGVFSTKSNAERIRDLVGGSVHPWELDPCIEALNQGHSMWVGEMRYDGSVERMDPIEIQSYQMAGERSIWRRSTAPAYRGQNVEDCLHGTVWAKDRQHAIKIFNEERVQYIASGEWKGVK